MSDQSLPLTPSSTAVATASDNDANINGDNNDITAAPTAPTASPRKPTTVWAWPWILHTLTLYIFVVFWVMMAIVHRYFLSTDHWGDALPGLDATLGLKFCMATHMACGATALLIGPFQLIPQLRRRISTRFGSIHRWLGRVYCIGALLSSIFGEAFLIQKGKLVGGYNMTAAFATAGLLNAVLTVQTYRTARQRQFTAHRRWALRSYSQVLAPVLYRYWYVFAELFGLYQAPVMPKYGGEINHEDDTIPGYFRLLDQLHCWGYWISAWLVAELVIRYLPPLKQSSPEESAMTSAPLGDDPLAETTASDTDIAQPLIQTDTDDDTATDEQARPPEESSLPDVNSTTEYNAIESSSSESISTRAPPTQEEEGSPAVINGIGIGLSIFTVATTAVAIFTASAA